MFSRVGAMMLETTYGIPVMSPDDPVRSLRKSSKIALGVVFQFLKAQERISQAITTGTFGRYLVDFFPILAHLPSWVPFKREAEVDNQDHSADRAC